MSASLRLTSALRRELNGNAFVNGSIQWGVVTALHTSPNSVDLYLDGTQTLADTTYLTAEIRYLDSYSPTVGDVVLVLRGTGGLKSDRVVLGKLA